MVIVFAHGAGAPSSSSWMTDWATRLSTLAPVVPFDYPYMRAGKRAPDRLPKLIEAHREAMVAARAAHRGPVVLAGKSMGSRVGCHLALAEPPRALVCFGYPLKPVGKGPLRDEVLLALRTPILFLQGTRDLLCPLDELERVRSKMTAPNTLHVVDAADHSLLVTKTELKARKETQGHVDARILEVVRAFLANLSTT